MKSCGLWFPSWIKGQELGNTQFRQSTCKQLKLKNLFLQRQRERKGGKEGTEADHNFSDWISITICSAQFISSDLLATPPPLSIKIISDSNPRTQKPLFLETPHSPSTQDWSVSKMAVDQERAPGGWCLEGEKLDLVHWPVSQSYPWAPSQ